jgi:hypothetical protein
MTIVDTPVAPELELVTIDLYRDIHKGIRAELFTVVGEAGRLDPSDRCARAALGDHVSAVADLLDSHAVHEDTVIEPVLLHHRPELAAQMADDHHVLDRQVRRFVALAQDLTHVASGDERRAAHELYLELASFTGQYLVHQDFEERVLMPALEAVAGIDAVGAMHGQIVGSIPPDEMARSLAVMLPAMNVDDRTEMLQGMRAGAPADVFEGILGLAQSVLPPADVAAVLSRLAAS